MDAQKALAAISEPTRHRIVLLLAESPRTVGEVATALGALQPQTTKHLQALEQAGLITVHPLGRRRVATLDRDAVRALAAHLDALATPTASDDAVAHYAEAVAAEEGRPSTRRRLSLERHIAAPRDRVWDAWTDPDLLPLWWAPEHFVLAAHAFAPVEGSVLSMTLREGDGAEHHAAGHMRKVTRLRRLQFDLPPLGPDGQPLFDVTFDVRFSDDVDGTRLRLDISASAIRPGAAAAVAGLAPGWNQLLDRLERLVTPAPG